jgi:hypothetical protein
MEYAAHVLMTFYQGYNLKVTVLTDIKKDINLKDAEEDILIVTDHDLCDYEKLLLAETSLFSLLNGPEIVRTYFENNVELALSRARPEEREYIVNLAKGYFTPLFVIRSNYENDN